MQLDLPGGEAIFQTHIQFWYLVNKPLQHQRAAGAVRPIPLPDQILTFGYTDIIINSLGIAFFALYQTTDGKGCHGVGIELLQIPYHILHADTIALQHIHQEIPKVIRIIVIHSQVYHFVSVKIVGMDIFHTPPNQNPCAFLHGLVPQFQMEVTQINQQFLTRWIPLKHFGRLFRFIYRIDHRFPTLRSNSV